jgi:hypothetical protein
MYTNRVATITQKGSRIERPLPPNAKMNVTRYSASGSTHKSGTEVRDCVRTVVSDTSRIVGRDENRSQRTHIQVPTEAEAGLAST